ncbi:MAG TPA: DUF6249 domain-containing protein [Ktedonobacterales bacterium]|nr:DUF6249 domain-containing protein [Ktedonobacterales bacterium]
MNDLVVLAGGWFLVLIVFLSFLTLRRYMEHRERMAMILRGITPPEKRPNALSQPKLARRSGVLQGGLITAMVGLALTIGLYPIGFLVPPSLTGPDRLGPWLLAGLIPLAVGIALILGHYLTPGHPVDVADGEPGAQPGEPVSRAHQSSPPASRSREEQPSSAEPGAFPEPGRWMFYRRESGADARDRSDEAPESKATP